MAGEGPAPCFLWARAGLGHTKGGFLYRSPPPGPRGRPGAPKLDQKNTGFPAFTPHPLPDRPFKRACWAPTLPYGPTVHPCWLGDASRPHRRVSQDRRCPAPVVCVLFWVPEGRLSIYLSIHVYIYYIYIMFSRFGAGFRPKLGTGTCPTAMAKKTLHKSTKIHPGDRV